MPKDRPEREPAKRARPKGPGQPRETPPDGAGPADQARGAARPSEVVVQKAAPDARSREDVVHVVAEPADGPRPAPERFVERERMLARLAAGLAHEIKNPLSTMAINLALLEEEWGRTRDGGEASARDKRALKRVATLQREVQRLETIVEDFLRYARGGEINRSPRDLGQLARETLDFVEPEDTRLGIRHHVDLPVGLPLVMLDEGAFRQALLNLLVNARHAMPMGGELIVRAQRRGHQVELSVTDTGVGMPPESLDRCFDVYYSTKKGGTGLGLSTTKRIVEEHGGTISVISEPNRGTSFSIVLPLIVEIHHGSAAEDRA